MQISADYNMSATLTTSDPGIIGTKQDAQSCETRIGVYIAEQLKLELSDEKTLVTKATDRAKFLGFEIRVTPQSNHTKKTKSGSTAQKLQRPCNAGSPNFRHSEKTAGTGSHLKSMFATEQRSGNPHVIEETCWASRPEYS